MNVLLRWKIVRILMTIAYLMGGWLLFTGTYEYTITDCTEQALADAGADIGIEDALKASAPAPPSGMSAGAKAAIVLGVAGGAAAGTAVAISRRSKRP